MWTRPLSVAERAVCALIVRRRIGATAAFRSENTAALGLDDRTLRIKVVAATRAPNLLIHSVRQPFEWTIPSQAPVCEQ